MRVVVVGASSLGRSAICIARAQGVSDILGVVDDAPAHAEIFEGVPYLGSTEALSFLFEDLGAFKLIVAIGNSRTRHDVFQRLKRAIPDVQLATIIHPQSTLLGGVRVNDGCIIFPGVAISPGAILGPLTVINSNASVGAGARLEAFVSIGPGANLGSNSVLEMGAYIGMGAAVAQNVRLGEWCTVGALSFVREDVPSGTLVVGAPARLVAEHT